MLMKSQLQSKIKPQNINSKSKDRNHLEIKEMTKKEQKLKMENREVSKVIYEIDRKLSLHKNDNNHLNNNYEYFINNQNRYKTKLNTPTVQGNVRQTYNSNQIAESSIRNGTHLVKLSDFPTELQSSIVSILEPKQKSKMVKIVNKDLAKSSGLIKNNGVAFSDDIYTQNNKWNKENKVTDNKEHINKTNTKISESEIKESLINLNQPTKYKNKHIPINPWSLY